MDKFDISTYKCFGDLPLEDFNRVGYSIYVIDKSWNYLFLNDFVGRNLGKRSEGLLGKNLWESFPELSTDPAFDLMRSNTEKGINSNLFTISPLTAQRLNITGHVLSDCYIFTSSIIPKKEDVLNELRDQLNRRSSTNSD